MKTYSVPFTGVMFVEACSPEEARDITDTELWNLGAYFINIGDVETEGE